MSELYLPMDPSISDALRVSFTHLASAINQVLPLQFPLSQVYLEHGHRQAVPGLLEHLFQNSIYAQALLDVVTGLRVYTDSRRSSVQLLAAEIRLLEDIASQVTEGINRNDGVLRWQNPNIGPPSDETVEALLDILSVFWVAFGFPQEHQATFQWLKYVFLTCRTCRISALPISVDRVAAIGHYPPWWAPELREEIMQGEMVAKEEIKEEIMYPGLTGEVTVKQESNVKQELYVKQEPDGW